MTELPRTQVGRVERPLNADSLGARRHRLFLALERVRETCDTTARLELDPVGIVRSYPRAEDREIVGLLAACLAFGKVATIRAKLNEALLRMGNRPAEAGDHPRRLQRRLAGWKHRVFKGEDVARLVIGARRVQVAHGSLGERFSADWARTGDLRLALAAFVQSIRDAGGLHPTPRGRRGPAHILGNPASPSSASKRLLLYLRWMIRRDDGVDLGLWPLSPSILVIPVDTHIHRLSLNLALTRRRAASWKTVIDIDGALRSFDPYDPAKYDFALCHLGMLSRCPSRRDPALCEGCGVKDVCRHWETESTG